MIALPLYHLLFVCSLSSFSALLLPTPACLSHSFHSSPADHIPSLSFSSQLFSLHLYSLSLLSFFSNGFIFSAGIDEFLVAFSLWDHQSHASSMLLLTSEHFVSHSSLRFLLCFFFPLVLCKHLSPNT